MPKYKNAGGQPRKKCMVAAYSLVNDFGATQTAAATVFKVSQPTIANWVKEVGFRKEIAGLKNELEGAREYIDELASEMNLIRYDTN